MQASRYKVYDESHFYPDDPSKNTKSYAELSRTIEIKSNQVHNHDKDDTTHVISMRPRKTNRKQKMTTKINEFESKTQNQ